MLPTVSIVVPVRNEEDYIVTCLEALVAQDYPGTMEILVVDGFSTDSTKEVAGRVLESQSKVAWRILDNPAQFTPAGLNRGIKAASGEVILRMDGHCVAAEDYVTKCVGALRATGAACVGGHMRARGKSLSARAVAASHRHPFGLGGGKFHDPKCEGLVDTVYLGCWLRNVLYEVGLFDESLRRNQDIELNARLRRRGGQVYLSPEIKSTYFCRASLVQLAKQNFANGEWNIYTALRSPKSLSLRHFVPLIFVLVLLMLGALSFGLAWARISLLGVLGVYAATSLVASISCGRRYGGAIGLLMPLVFAVLHFSYGLGSLAGLVKYVLLGRRPGRLTSAGQKPELKHVS